MVRIGKNHQNQICTLILQRYQILQIIVKKVTRKIQKADFIIWVLLLRFHLKKLSYLYIKNFLSQNLKNSVLLESTTVRVKGFVVRFSWFFNLYPIMLISTLPFVKIVQLCSKSGRLRPVFLSTLASHPFKNVQIQKKCFHGHLRV